MDPADTTSRTTATRSAGARLALIASSFERLIGVPLVDSGGDLANALWTAPRAILAHGLQDDPVFFYGNRLALELFESDIDGFLGMPSRLSAEPVARHERARLLARVQSDGFIDDYCGVRISVRGNRFRIERAVVWNIVGPDGAMHGQAATFDRWTPLGQVR